MTPFSSVSRSAVLVGEQVGRRDAERNVLLGGQVHDVVGDAAVFHAPIRRHDEAELVHAGVGRELTRAWVVSWLMSPMFGPSGVSIGQIRP